MKSITIIKRDGSKEFFQPEITSLTLRDQVLIELELVDPQVADLFRWYQKTKE